jgi:hypothetical protein
MEHSQFLPLIQQGWANPTNQQDEAKIITAKFKNLRHIIREWQASLTNLMTLIKNVKMIIQLLEAIGDYRHLSLQEWNFKHLLQERLICLLQQQKNILEAKRLH